MERTRYRIEVGRQGLEAIEDANGSWEYHADAQRALDAEREKVKLGSCEACWNLAWVLCRDDEPNAVPMKCANGTTYWRCDYCWYKQQLATLQAQLAQPIHICQRCGRVGRDGWVTARYECDELHGSLQCPDCRCIDLETNTAKELAALCTQAQAQLRHVEGENELLKSGQRYMALEKERDTLRQLVEALPVVDVQEVSVWLSPDESGWLVSKRPAFQAGLYWAKFRTQAEADSFRSLLAYRATLAAQDPPHPTEERHE